MCPYELHGETAFGRCHSIGHSTRKLESWDKLTDRWFDPAVTFSIPLASYNREGYIPCLLATRSHKNGRFIPTYVGIAIEI